MDIASSMGPHLKGHAPPFTPNGYSSFMPIERFPNPQSHLRLSHVGIIARWVADADYLARLLPQPLEPSETTTEISLFVNRTVSTGAEVDADLVEPSEAHFNEVLIVIPC